MTDEGLRFHRAIVRPPPANFAEGITVAGLGPPDLALALSQHAAYCNALTQLGLWLTRLPPDAAFPDSTFVEDTAIVTSRGAIVTRPGAASRAGEVVAMQRALSAEIPVLSQIQLPGTVDGGDVCQAGEHFFIGLSQRTNAAGAEQLAAWLQAFGFTASTVDVRNTAGLLHLKSGIAWLGDRQLVLAEALADHAAFRGHEAIVVGPKSTYAANCVRVNDAVLVPTGYPDVAEKIAALGYTLVPLEMSEFRKMDGGLSCLSVRW